MASYKPKKLQVKRRSYRSDFLFPRSIADDTLPTKRAAPRIENHHRPFNKGHTVTAASAIGKCTPAHLQ
jgi:hypothetical protein